MILRMGCNCSCETFFDSGDPLHIVSAATVFGIAGYLLYRIGYSRGVHSITHIPMVKRTQLS